MTTGPTIEVAVHFGRGGKGRRLLKAGPEPPAPPPEPAARSRVPRIARLMALAIRFEGMVGRGEVEDYAALAELGRVTRARMSQVVNLLNLAPDIQEAILHLPLVAGETETVTERHVRAIAGDPDWERQRAQWRYLRSTGAPAGSARTLSSA